MAFYRGQGGGEPVTVPVTATAAVVTTREMAVAVGTTKQAVMAAVAVGTAKEAARACTLPTSCGSTPRNLRRDLIRGTNGLHYLKIKKALRGPRVVVTHQVEVRRKYRIAGLTNQSSRDSRFELSTGETKPVRDFFRGTYKLQLRYVFSPACKLVQSRNPTIFQWRSAIYSFRTAVPKEAR